MPNLIRKSFQNRFSKFDFNDMKQSLSNVENAITHTDIKRIKEGKLGAQFWVTYASCVTLAKDAVRLHLEQVDTIQRLIRKYPLELQFVSSSDGNLNTFLLIKIIKTRYF